MRTWIVELQDEADADSVACVIDPLPEISHVKVTEYGQNPMEGIRALYEKYKDIGRWSSSGKDNIEIRDELWQAIKKAVGK
jgi:hypothetical protein